jgi:bifunctional DNA-binding transcriptional regulator/antitoxin component of YhaV-PrlF toxin-antitoxin module
MSLVRVGRGGEIALSDEVLRKLGVGEGDELEVEAAEGGVLLKPVAASERETAWRRIREAQRSVRYVGPEPRPSPEEEERMIFEEVEAFRHGRG